MTNQQEKSDMELLLIIAFVLIVYAVTPRPKDLIGDIPASFEEKKCPPHAWRHDEIKDAAGNVIGWKLVCGHCGPLAPQQEVKREI